VNVLVPLNAKEHLSDYIDCGASEFYLGFYCDKWRDKFGEYADINRLTGFRKLANSYSFEEVLELVGEGKSKHRSIYITFNSSLYSQEQIEWVEDYMKKLKEVEVDGVIVSCIELAVIAKRIGLYTIISTIAGIYNQDIAKFYQEHGADRIILPRDLSVDEIEDIITAVPKVEYEVFMMRNGCVFSDSNCLGMHRNELCSVCKTLRSSEIESIETSRGHCNQQVSEVNNHIYCKEFHNVACGLCSIYRFVKMGIAACKIVGRSDDYQNICEDILIVKQNIDLALGCSSQEEFFDKMIFPKNHKEVCKTGLSCYYPEIRFQ
jgi:putative protease